MEIVEALEIGGNPGRFRATLRHDDPPMDPMPLCDCENGHASKREALDCQEAIKNMPVGLVDDKEKETKTVVEANIPYKDIDRLKEAIMASQKVLAKHLELGGITAEEAISSLLGILDNKYFNNVLHGIIHNPNDNDKPDVELEKLALKDGDIVLVRYSSSDMSAYDCCRFIEALKLSRAFQNAKDASIIFIEGETDIKTLSEDNMNKAGWFKRGEGRR
ncbi:hypothetical protein KAR91_36960 [Candidatus Pacearchaeota archaeon]|nr:hypothetical protein [Candidatus Pacearchaeota archaeon]